MAATVYDAIRGGNTLVAEAGTGTGKTFAYLVPVLLSGGKVLISTGTKPLQDQLFRKDLPAVLASLKLNVATALLKGRANYLCLHRLDRAEAEGLLPTREDAMHLRSDPALRLGDGHGRSCGTAGRARERRRVAAGDLDPRQLPRRRMSALHGLLRLQGATRGAGRRRRRRQPPPVPGRPRDARGLDPRFPAGGRHRRARRSASAAFDRRRLLRRHAVARPVARGRTRRAHPRPVARPRRCLLDAADQPLRACGARRAARHSRTAASWPDRARRSIASAAASPCTRASAVSTTRRPKSHVRSRSTGLATRELDLLATRFAELRRQVQDWSRALGETPREDDVAPTTIRPCAGWRYRSTARSSTRPRWRRDRRSRACAKRSTSRGS